MAHLLDTIKPVCSALALLLATSCSTAGSVVHRLASLPTRYVIASVRGDVRSETPVQVQWSGAGNLQAWSSGSLPAGPWARGGGSPGIGSNGEIYVIAFWGGQGSDAPDARIVKLFVSLSNDGQNWSEPVRVTSDSVGSNTMGIVRPAGLSVAALPDGSWFASFADQTGVIKVVRLPIDGNQLAGPNFVSTVTEIADVTTDATPALAEFNGHLVLMWPQLGTHILREITSRDGSTWPSGSAATAVGPPPHRGGNLFLSTPGSPFLHSSNQALFLTIPTNISGSGRLITYLSTDEHVFRVVRSVDISDLTQGGATAGPASIQYATVYPGNSNTMVFTSERPLNLLATQTGRRVTAAAGPGQ